MAGSERPRTPSSGDEQTGATVDHARLGLTPTGDTPVPFAQVGRGRRLVATLAYDTPLEALPRGIRTLHRSERRLLFLADEYEILLKLAVDHAPGLSTLSGQVLADGLPATRAAVVLVGAAHPRRLPVDEDGGFRTTALPVGTYRLGVAVADDSIVVPDVELGDSLLGERHVS